MTTPPVELAPEPVHDDVTWVSSYDVNPFDVPTAEKTALLIGWTQRLLRPTPSSTRPRRSSRSRRTSTTPTSPAPAPPSNGSASSRTFEAMGTDQATGVFDSMASIAPPVGRGWEYLTGGTLRLGRRARRGPRTAAPRSSRRRASRPATYDLVIHPVQPVADHPRVDRPRHRARPRPRLRGQLRRHLVRDVRQARLAALRLPGHERHRRPHRRARPGHRRVRRRGCRRPRAGTSSATASWSATSSTGRWRTA